MFSFGIGPCLHESGLTPKKFTYKEDAELVNYGIGLASLVPRTTASVEELSQSVEHTKAKGLVTLPAKNLQFCWLSLSVCVLGGGGGACDTMAEFVTILEFSGNS